MNKDAFIKISGKKDDKRIPSRVLEEIIHRHIKNGRKSIEIEGYGQHGIGGRLWDAGNDEIHIRITGQSGQRAGSLGNANTRIEVMGPASDDIGWLNAGSEIIVHGNASNGVMNGAAQGKVFIGGSIGARGMTMTKRNPRFEPPELWVLGTAGDYFGEFMAGGIAVICGHDTDLKDQILGYRPLVGMVGGKVFTRGNAKGFSQKDAKLSLLSDEDWNWLLSHLSIFLENINKKELLKSFSKRSQWQLLEAKSPQEKASGPEKHSMSWFREKVWEKELGKGGLIGDLQEIKKDKIPLITRGDLRRYIPVWEQGRYMAPCQAACPTGIPVQKRWDMVRLDNIDEAISMGLEYTPFPSIVCGYLCPSPCMASCTRNQNYMSPIDVRLLGRAGENVKIPKPSKKTKMRIAVIGAGPGGISAAWHLTLKGHTAVLFDTGDTLGGKISSVIPGSRIPKKTLKAELNRVKKVISNIKLNQEVNNTEFLKIKYDYDFTIVAAGSKRSRSLPVPGIERAVFANDFLESSKKDQSVPGKKVVIIGAGNVGCDVATEAHRLGAEEVTMIDVQEPAAFGKEKEDAQSIGAIFRWPCFTKKITKKGVVLQDGEFLKADTVVISIGDIPDLDFLDETITLENGFITVDQFNRTSDPRVFAIGDVVGPGLITDAIGAGRRAALNIDRIIGGKTPDLGEILPQVDKQRISLEYYNPRNNADNLSDCGTDCASCGQCRDCGICVAVCPEGAIERVEINKQDFEYKVDQDLCIGCGFCKGACPCGIWDLIPNTAL
ncbi:MAG: FAD-dependent oxidoreductase [Desulfobacula sp.]|uniref:FAD-dependent oxidoreductase n=1 Tax=Desulfobacula sp. TaxID=2593537 RepID=UPI001DFDD514|nr:FAD-dependent oxidoreductase [Desulfobacula sp.]MBT3486763.1 FAD-dependent oxidoreductase [Desulfobacula sp.]MBT3806383.1 FAD-dependent oxidoreductase [Desulfobacula sp.]MBT4023979.1 FAD-dependent oxidoreductase [Desulfobacula sp.]MBT4198341.1 FAD-dependent oxidoreductase [Desulfobacula sp.]